MNHDEAFLQEIIANPDEDAPRLVYADYLEEHGDPDRADFIRVQCALESLDQDDERRPVLAAREHQLLKQHEIQWVGPLREWANGWMFRRGFVEYLDIQSKLLIDQAEAIFRQAPVRELYPRCSTVRSLLSLFQNPILNRLAKLYLPWWQSEPDLIDALVESEMLSRLTSLVLCSPGWPQVVEWRRLFSWAGLSRLTHLDVWCEMGEGDLLPFIVNVAQLAELRLCKIRMDFPPQSLPAFREAVRHLTVLSNMRRLTTLDLSANGMAISTLFSLLDSPALPMLERLNLDRSARLPTPGTTLWPAPRPPSLVGKLRHFSLRHNNLSSQVVGLLVNSPAVERLRSLDLSDNGFKDAGVAVLASSRFLTRLIRLALAGNGIRFGGVQSRRLFENPGPLRVLYLNRNPLGDASLKALVASPLWHQLTLLDLSCTWLTDEGIRSLVSGPRPERLTTLYLDDNQITEDGFRTLAASPLYGQLHTLSLLGNRIPADRLRELTVARPGRVCADILEMMKSKYR
jgi:uncharacterized protein (TIGR02996 family)